MNKRTNKTQRAAVGNCLCQGAGPVISDMLRRLGPPESARRHFEAARLEFLKGLRAVLDERIAQRSKSKGKGEKIAVE